MISSLDAYVQAVEMVFKKDISCFLKREYYSMLINIPKDVEFVSDVKLTQAGKVRKENFVTRTETSLSDDWILDTLFGVPKVTMDEVMNPDLHLDTPYVVNIAVADIAELVHKRAVVNLMNPVEIAMVHERCKIYLNAIRDYQLYDLHFQSPPAEDIAAIKKLKDILEPLASIYNQTGDADTFMSRLLGLTKKTMSGSSSKMAIEINGATNNLDLKDPFKGYTNPYSFANY